MPAEDGGYSTEGPEWSVIWSDNSPLARASTPAQRFHPRPAPPPPVPVALAPVFALDHVTLESLYEQLRQQIQLAEPVTLDLEHVLTVLLLGGGRSQTFA